MKTSMFSMIWLSVMTMFHVPMIWTIDMDYELRLRRLYTRPDGLMTCRALLGWVRVVSDGTCVPFQYPTGCYVKTWLAANDIAPKPVNYAKDLE